MEGERGQQIAHTWKCKETYGMCEKGAFYNSHEPTVKMDHLVLMANGHALVICCELTYLYYKIWEYGLFLLTSLVYYNYVHLMVGMRAGTIGR